MLFVILVWYQDSQNFTHHNSTTVLGGKSPLKFIDDKSIFLTKKIKLKRQKEMAPVPLIPALSTQNKLWKTAEYKLTVFCKQTRLHLLLLTHGAGTDTKNNPK